MTFIHYLCLWGFLPEDPIFLPKTHKHLIGLDCQIKLFWWSRQIQVRTWYRKKIYWQLHVRHVGSFILTCGISYESVIPRIEWETMKAVERVAFKGMSIMFGEKGQSWHGYHVRWYKLRWQLETTRIKDKIARSFLYIRLLTRKFVWWIRSS